MADNKEAADNVSEKTADAPMESNPEETKEAVDKDDETKQKMDTDDAKETEPLGKSPENPGTPLEDEQSQSPAPEIVAPSFGETSPAPQATDPEEPSKTDSQGSIKDTNLTSSSNVDVKEVDSGILSAGDEGSRCETPIQDEQPQAPVETAPTQVEDKEPVSEDPPSEKMETEDIVQPSTGEVAELNREELKDNDAEEEKRDSSPVPEASPAPEESAMETDDVEADDATTSKDNEDAPETKDDATEQTPAESVDTEDVAEAATPENKDDAVAKGDAKDEDVVAATEDAGKEAVATDNKTVEEPEKMETVEDEEVSQEKTSEVGEVDDKKDESKVDKSEADTDKSREDEDVKDNKDDKEEKTESEATKTGGETEMETDTAEEVESLDNAKKDAVETSKADKGDDEKDKEEADKDTAEADKGTAEADKSTAEADKGKEEAEKGAEEAEKGAEEAEKGTEEAKKDAEEAAVEKESKEKESEDKAEADKEKEDSCNVKDDEKDKEEDKEKSDSKKKVEEEKEKPSESEKAKTESKEKEKDEESDPDVSIIEKEEVKEVVNLIDDDEEDNVKPSKPEPIVKQSSNDMGLQIASVTSGAVMPTDDKPIPAPAPATKPPASGGKTSKSKQPQMCIVCGKVGKCKYNIKRNEEIKHLCDEPCFIKFKGNPTLYLKSNKKQEPTPAPVEKPAANGSSTKKTPQIVKTCHVCQLMNLNTNKPFCNWHGLDFCDEGCLQKFQNSLNTSCSLCTEVIAMPSRGLYVFRIANSDIRTFCTQKCLSDFRKMIRLCAGCNKDLSNCPDAFSAPVGNQKTFVEFCTQQCMERYEQKKNAPEVEITSITPGTTSTPAVCSVCNKKEIPLHSVKLKNVLHKLCSAPCLQAFQYANKLTLNKCENCSKVCSNEETKSFFIQYEGNQKKFCSDHCVETFRNANQKVVPCAWCGSKKRNFDMIERVDSNNKYQLFCTLNCLSLYRVNLQAKSNMCVCCDHCRKYTPAQYHLTMSDASVRNFCSYNCVMAFQRQFTTGSTSSITPNTSVKANNKPSTRNSQAKLSVSTAAVPIISNVVSLAPSAGQKQQVNIKNTSQVPVVIGQTKGQAVQTPSTPSTAIQQQIIVQPPAPKIMKNKSLLCKPFVQTKATSCRPSTQNKKVGTEEEPCKPVLIPVPIPVYVPTPLAMYASPMPVFIPIPVPIPVPIFIPTTKKSASKILKHIKEIQNKIPADPLEAELLMMAEAVAGDKASSDSDSESEKEPEELPVFDDIEPESPMVNKGKEGEEDMLQMALRVAEEISEPIMDLEDNVQPVAVKTVWKEPEQEMLSRRDQFITAWEKFDKEARAIVRNYRDVLEENNHQFKKTKKKIVYKGKYRKKRKSTAVITKPSTSKRLRSSQPTDVAEGTTPSLPKICIICKNAEKFIKKVGRRTRDRLCYVMTVGAGTLRKAAVKRGDEAVLGYVRDDNCVYQDIVYHQSCYTSYTNFIQERRQVRKEDNEPYQETFDKFCEDVIRKRLFDSKEVLRISNLMTLLTDMAMDIENEDISEYSPYTLRRRLLAKFPQLVFVHTPGQRYSLVCVDEFYNKEDKKCRPTKKYCNFSPPFTEKRDTDYDPKDDEWQLY